MGSPPWEVDEMDHHTSLCCLPGVNRLSGKGGRGIISPQWIRTPWVSFSEGYTDICEIKDLVVRREYL